MHPAGSFREKNPRGHSLPLGTHLHRCCAVAQMFNWGGNSRSSSTQGMSRHCWASGSHSLHPLHQHLVLGLKKKPKSVQESAQHITWSSRVTFLGSHTPAVRGRQQVCAFHPAHLNHRHGPTCPGSFSRSEAPKMDHSEGFAHLTPRRYQMREPCRSPVLHPAKIIHKSLQRKDQSFTVLSETTQPCWQ